jgi:hypothetical protein
MTRGMLLAALIVVASLMASFRPSVDHAHADSAPLYPAAGGTLTTTGQTAVQMASQQVSVEIRHDPEADSGYRAEVEATFDLYNPGEATSLTVGYPEELFRTIGEHPPLRLVNLAVRVDGQPVTVSSELVRENASGNAFEVTDSDWLVWPVDFESGASHLVTVSFEQELRGQSREFVDGRAYGGVFFFDYVLISGAGWDGPIGEAEISVQFPEDIDLDTFYTVSPMAFGLPAEAVALRQSQKVIWRNGDFEPDENFTIAFLSPEVSAELRRARQIAASSNDAADHGRLAELLFSLSNSPLGQAWAFNPGNERLLSEGMLEVGRGLALDPDSGAVWSAMLRLERDQAYTLRHRVAGEPFGTLKAIVAAGRVLELDPTDEEARRFLEGVREVGLGRYNIDPRVDAMVREAASLALAGAGPSAPPPTGSGAAVEHSSTGSSSRLMTQLGIELAGALGLAGVLAGASAAVIWTRRSHRR